MHLKPERDPYHHAANDTMEDEELIELEVHEPDDLDE